MTTQQFINNYMVQDWGSEKILFKDIAIQNVKVGQEALRLATLFGLNPSSLMMPSSESSIVHSQQYITFVNMGGGSFIIADEYSKQASIKDFYYGEVEEAINEIFEIYPEMLQNASGVKDTSVNDMYKMFGMEVNDE